MLFRSVTVELPRLSWISTLGACALLVRPVATSGTPGLPGSSTVFSSGLSSFCGRSVHTLEIRVPAGAGAGVTTHLFAQDASISWEAGPRWSLSSECSLLWGVAASGPVPGQSQEVHVCVVTHLYAP